MGRGTLTAQENARDRSGRARAARPILYHRDRPQALIAALGPMLREMIEAEILARRCRQKERQIGQLRQRYQRLRSEAAAYESQRGQDALIGAALRLTVEKMVRQSQHQRGRR